ncbi:ABC transporter ATP-binding protein [Dellaglioa sp. P0083]|uniref:ABC transporter ATP-binding protein n=1 Tax=Dellaglioa kimchii TaxID=3344667 RepID=UPI0038D47E4E
MLTINNLTKSFGKKVVLKGINFTIAEGEIVGLVGANGAGKTTIMKSILGLSNYQTGEITIDGKIVSTTSHQGLEEVGALIEYPGIYPFLSGYDHLKLFSEINTKEELDEIVADLHMTDYINRKAKSYSLGMKQKLGIALALLNRPRLIILDEPMNGLDPQATRDVRELVLKLSKRGTAFLISSHILGELEKIVDHFIILNEGKIMKAMSTTELSDSSKQYVLLETTSNEQAKVLLKAANYELAVDQTVKVKVDEQDTLANIIQVLYDNKIQINDVRHQEHDMEESLLNLLDSNDGGKA